MSKTSESVEKPKPTCSSAFQSFVMNEQESSMLYFGNGLMDDIFKFKNIQESDKEELKTLLDQFCNDKVFNEFILKEFDSNNSTFGFKSLIQNSSTYPLISEISAFNILNDVFNVTNNFTIQNYLLYLTLSPVDLYNMADEKFKPLNINYTSFQHFLHTFIDKFLDDRIREKHLHRSKVNITPLAFICQNDTNKDLKPTKVKYLNIKIDYSKCKSFDSVRKQVLINYRALNHKYNVKGFNFDGSFSCAVKLFSYIAPVWDQMSASSSLRDKPLPQMGRSFGLSGGGAKYNDSDVVRIFAGNYGLVKSSEPASEGPVAIDLVSDFQSFNQLPNYKKLQVSNFLLSNRKRFNIILENATKVVINNFQYNLNNNAVSRSLGSRQFAPQYARNVGFNVENGMINDTMTFVSRLQKSFVQKNPTSFSDAISFIVHDYIPMLDQFSNRCDARYGTAESKSMMNKFATDNVLNIVGVGSQIDFNYMRNRGTPSISFSSSPSSVGSTESPSSTSITGGRGSKNNKQPKVENNFGYYVDELEIIDELNSPVTKVEGGNSGKDLVNAFIDGQKKFNKAYEDIYRQLIRELNNVNLTDIHRQTYTKLYTICGQFESIAIKNPNTTTYLSGYYGAKDYNLLYTRAVENTINSINAAGVTAFAGVVKVLDSLKQLLINTRKGMIEIRNKYINAPKGVSELFIVAVKDIKQPCRLTNDEFIALSDAVSRIYNTIKSTASESSIRNTKSQIEEYMSKVQDRTELIKEHYAEKINGIRIMYSRFFDRDNTFGRDLKIGFEEQKRDALIYINSIVDIQLAKDRIDNLKNLTLTQEQINTIERAYTAFKNMQITPEFNKEMKKIGKLLDPSHTTLSDVYKLISKLKKLVISSQYFNFLAQLHKELKLISDFDWNKFSDQLANLMVISSINVDPRHKFSETDHMSMNRWIHNQCTKFEKFCQAKHFGLKLPINSGYLFMKEYLSPLCTSTNMSVIRSFRLNGTLNFDSHPINTITDFKTNITDINNATVGGLEDNALKKIKERLEKTHLLLYVQQDGSDVKTIKKDGAITNAWEQFETVINIVSTDGDINTKESANLSYIIKAYYDICTKYYDSLDERTNIYSAISSIVPYYAKHLGTFLFYFIHYSPELKFEIDIARENIHEYSLDIAPEIHAETETELVRYVFDAFNTNIISVIDKYWSIRYKGTLSLPLNLATTLRGGDKQDGGTIFDSTNLHDQTLSTIIVEATPFYICACNICEYYMKRFNEKSKEANEYSLYLRVNKISTLYPVYEIFRKYNATIKSLTPAQLKVLLSVFNKYWEQTSGNESYRLSRSIDLLFNELNACLIFSNKLQIDIFKNTGKLDSKIVDTLNLRLGKLVNSMKDVISASILDNNVSPEDQAKYFEQQMGEAYRRIKNDPEPQRLATLKAILSDDRGVEDQFKDYYKFMELVVTPMLTTATCYSNIFMLFDTYSFTGDNSKPKTYSIDFTEILVTYPDFVSSKETAGCSAWELIEKIRKERKYYLKSVLVDHPIVLTYNRILLRKALQDMHDSGKFNLPKFWIIMDENTYPTVKSISFTEVGNENHFTKSDYLILLKQIYPTVNAKTLADYYNHAINEFYSDFDHYVHNFISYPGISDKTIKVISTTLHDSIKVNEYDDNSKVYKLSGMHDEKINEFEFDKVVSILNEVKVEKISTYPFPPAPYEKFVLPRLNDGGSTIDSLSLSLESKNNTRIDGTSIYIKAENNPGIGVCNYTWSDWVIFNIAKCDKTNYCLPYKLLQTLKNSGELSLSVRGASYIKKSGNTQYNQNIDGSYSSLLTQNIIARSESMINSEKVEYSTLNSAWIAGLISVTPYLINTIQSVKDSIQQTVEYKGINVYRELCVLSEALTLFYDEIGNYTPFMSFMTDTLQLTSSKVKPHLFAELLSFVEKNSVDTMDVRSFIKIEWANMWFFNNLDGISFPTFKNKDKFEWIKTYASDKINNGVFGNEFNTTIQTLGRNVWGALIAKSIEYNSKFKNINRELDSLVIRCINTLSECDLNIIQAFLDNVVNFYLKTSQGERLSLTGKGLTGGNKYTKVKYTNEISLGHVNEILAGIGVITNEPKEVVEKNIDTSYFNINNETSYYQIYPSDKLESKLYIKLKNVETDYSLKNLPKRESIVPKKIKFFERANNARKIRNKLIRVNLGRVINGSQQIANVVGFTPTDTFWEELTVNIENVRIELIRKYDNVTNYFEDKYGSNDFEYNTTAYKDNMTNERIIFESDTYIKKSVPSSKTMKVIEFMNNYPIIKSLMEHLLRTASVEVYYYDIINEYITNVKNILKDNLDQYFEDCLMYELNTIFSKIINAGEIIRLIRYEILNVIKDYNSNHKFDGDTDNDFISLYFKVYNPILDGIKSAERILNTPLFTGLGDGINIFNYTKMESYTNITIQTNNTDDISKTKSYNIITALKAMAIANGIYRDKLDDCKKIVSFLNVYLVASITNIAGAPSDKPWLENIYKNPTYVDTTKISSMTSSHSITSNIDAKELLSKLTWNFESKQLEFQFEDDDVTAKLLYFANASTDKTDAQIAIRNGILNVLHNIASNIDSVIDTTPKEIIDDGKVITTPKYDLNSLHGGDINEYEDIIEIAKVIATNESSRAIYIDPSIEGSYIYPGIKTNNDLVEESFYLYKFLYNPNLATLFNKTSLPNTTFIQLILGRKQKFIIDPKHSSDLNFSINLNKIINKCLFIDNCKDTTNGINIIGSDLYDNLNKTYSGKMLLKIAENITDNDKEFVMNGRDKWKTTNSLVVTKSEFNLDQSKLIVSDKRIELLLRPITKNITFDERMIQNVPLSKAHIQWIFSPQKDIFNVTTEGSVTEIRVPAVILGVDNMKSTPDKIFINGNTSDSKTPDSNKDIVIKYSHMISYFNTVSMDKCIIEHTSVIDVSSLSQFKDAKMNPIHKFIDKLLQENVGKLTEFTNKNANYGFDIGSLGLGGHGLFGGAVNSNITFIHSFMNSSAEFTESNSSKLLSSVYNYPDNSENVYENGCNLYKSIFGLFRGGKQSSNNCEVMFKYIINYFHKYNISFDAIYNQICFPSIIYGTSVLNAYIPRLSETINSIEWKIDSTNASKTFKNGIMSFIYEYISGFTINDTKNESLHTSLYFSSESKWQMLFLTGLPKPDTSTNKTVVARNQNMPFNKVIECINGDLDNPDKKKNSSLWFANQFSAPSVGNNFFSEIINYITYIPAKIDNLIIDGAIKVKDYDKDDKYFKNLYQLFPSGIMNCIRHFDVMSTFIYTMFMLLKQTSFYDHEMDRDTSYFKVPNPEPLSVV